MCVEYVRSHTLLSWCNFFCTYKKGHIIAKTGMCPNKLEVDVVSLWHKSSSKWCQMIGFKTSYFFICFQNVQSYPFPHLVWCIKEVRSSSISEEGILFCIKVCIQPLVLNFALGTRFSIVDRIGDCLRSSDTDYPKIPRSRPILYDTIIYVVIYIAI